MQEKEQVVEPPAPTRSYGRKRKMATEETPAADPEPTQDAPLSTDTTTLPVPQADAYSELNSINSIATIDEAAPNEAYDEQKKGRGRAKRPNVNQFNGSHDQQKTSNNNDISPSFEVDQQEKSEDNSEKPSVKLVISKKKGSIFKSRAIETDSGESIKQKRHVYKHKWDDDSPEEKRAASDA